MTGSASDVWILDGHNDLPMALRAGSGSSVLGLDGPRPALHTDLARLRAGQVGGQFWSVYVTSALPEPEAVVATLQQIDIVHRMISAYPGTLAAAWTADEVLAARASGRIASLLGIEGGHSLTGSLGVLRMMARLGVRYVTLTHNDNTPWADSATDLAAAGGLTDVGRAIVAEMNRIGVLVDLSHTAATTQKDALAASRAPVIFSHSSCRAVCDHVRNPADDVLDLLAGNGGVLQVTFVPAFVSERVREWELDLKAERERLDLPRALSEWHRAPHPGEEPTDVPVEIPASQDPRLQEWLAQHPSPRATLADVADHLDHARERIGVDHLGLGGDFDGVDALPDGLQDVSTYPALLAELSRRGWSDADLAAVGSGNVLRVLRAAEDVAEEIVWPGAPA
ncbi:membrane dipeptidase [Nakamurella flavida]|uniref:Membrane dipeptidase n=1 Tax=Nakamurella flavida TaxID=363630 RepID=A0A938YRN0_9ACTN|nr:dipeptidase [Nakamurella flavida]MBM9478204.1 membrane dipeptidase [Nakamurella flavida]MDP9778574.1 membrane dipeptidase [Nakamurella flavida]